MVHQIRRWVMLAGGNGTRLLPLSRAINKALIAVNQRFVIDYPIENIKAMGCEHLTVILGGSHFEQIPKYLCDGEDFGIKISYVYQKEPVGISQAISLCEEVLKGDEQFGVILGDNIFAPPPVLQQPIIGCAIVLNNHAELHRFGVASIDHQDQIVKIQEKPKKLDPKLTNLAITGMYFFDQDFFKYYRETKKSARGEYEITDIIKKYQQDQKLGYIIYDGAWLDCGTFESLKTLQYFI